MSQKTSESDGVKCVIVGCKNDATTPTRYGPMCQMDAKDV